MRVLVVVLVVLRSTGAAAWGYDEHHAIGHDSYARACADLLADRTLDAEARQILQEIACDSIAEKAELFGQACAIAADHLREPDDFLAVDADEIILSFTEYAAQALENSGHFHPFAPRNWRRLHTEAEELLIKTRVR
jgi:hypothetical protein